MTQEKNIGNKCIFCEIIAGREAASKIYEDDKILAFMNIRPVNTGEFMVIPKQHIDHFLDIPDDLAAHILLTAQRLARKVQKKFKPKRMGYVVHGFGVPHAHLNIVPLEHPDDIVSYKFARIENDQVIFDPKQIPLISREELDRIAKTIKEAED
jgi:histidine triad (HIT) family protein